MLDISFIRLCAADWLRYFIMALVGKCVMSGLSANRVLEFEYRIRSTFCSLRPDYSFIYVVPIMSSTSHQMCLECNVSLTRKHSSSGNRSEITFVLLAHKWSVS